MLSAQSLSVRAARKRGSPMWMAHIICSGRGCTEEREVVIDELEELDRIGCTCGHGFVLLSISAVELV
jgi:hypothetical protein